jgi:hypothetical protein
MHVEHDYVGAQFVSQFETFVAIGAAADDFEAWFAGKSCYQTVECGEVIFNY